MVALFSSNTVGKPQTFHYYGRCSGAEKLSSDYSAVLIFSTNYIGGLEDIFGANFEIFGSVETLSNR